MVSQIAAGKSLALQIAGKDVALFNVDGQIHAIENSCPHQGSALTGGCLDGRIVSCPAHGLRFDVTTGAHVSVPELTVATFPVQLVDDRVLVAVTE